MKKKRYATHSFMIALTVALALVACSDDDPETTTNTTTQTTTYTTIVNSEAKTGRLLVSVDPTTTRSLTYNGVSTTIGNGELIGCVITKGDTKDVATYYATSAWEYHSSTGYLTIDRWWVPEQLNGQTDYTWCLYEAVQDSKCDFLTYDSANYTGINSEDYLYFYFYYPFVDPTNEDASDLPSVSTNGVTTYQIGLPVGSTYVSTGISSYSKVTRTETTDDDGNTTSTSTYKTTSSTVSLPAFDWETFPVFVGRDQSTLSKINYSDFLYDAYEVGANNETVGTLTLGFRKETSTIRVTSQTEISDVKLINGNNPIKVGHYADLHEDEDVTSSDPDDYQLSNDESISGYPLSTSSDDGYEYRFILPPQSNWQGRVQYTYDSTTHNFDLSDFGDGTLEKNTLYTVTVLPPEDMYLYFTSSGFNSASSEVYSYGFDSYSSSAFGNSYTASITLERIDLSYYMKLENRPGTYIQFSLQSTAQITIYLVYKSNASKININQLGSDDTYTTTSYELSAASGNSYLYYTGTLEKGTYKIKRNSGDTFVLLVKLSYDT